MTCSHIRNLPKDDPPTYDHLNPTVLDKPTYLMNVPFSLSAEVPNNVWMTDVKAEARHIDINKAINQFLQLYHYMASEALVYLLPTPQVTGLQDLVYSANMGVVLEHMPDKNTVVLSNFKTEVRRPETKVGREFFHAMGYHVVDPPWFFEGDAELKHLHDNVYAGGYGIRSDRRAYDWMNEQFDMRVIALEETEPYLYHLDCTVCPLTREDTLVCTEMYTPQELKQLEQVTNIVDVSMDDCFSGICNSVRLGNSLLNASNIHEMKSSDEYYEEERHKNRTLEDLAVRFAFEVSFFNLSEFLKSGALLSCMVMHLNRKSFDITLM
jgi:N-dimethylarginine dimethylaminohydrolase